MRADSHYCSEPALAVLEALECDYIVGFAINAKLVEIAAPWREQCAMRRCWSPFQRAVPTTPADRDGCTCRLLPHLTRPFPLFRRVGIRDFTFEACSGFTRVTARMLAQPPEAAFVTGLRRDQLPGHAAR